MAGGATEVDQATLGEEDDVATRGHGVTVNLGLDVRVLSGSLLEPSDVNFCSSGREEA